MKGYVSLAVFYLYIYDIEGWINSINQERKEGIK